MSKLNKRAKDIFGVACMSAAILTAILLTQWAFGQERPAVPFAESPVPTSSPHVAAQVHVAVPVVVVVPDPGVASVSPGGPVIAVESTVATGVTSIDDQQHAADTGVMVLDADIFTAAQPAQGETFPWASPFGLRDGLLDGAVLDSARAMSLLFACDDEPALREFLIGEGFTLRQPGGSDESGDPTGPANPASPVRALPRDFLVGVTAYEYAGAYCTADQEVLESVDPPAGATPAGTSATPADAMLAGAPVADAAAAGVTVLRFVDRSARAVTFALANPNRPYLIYVAAEGLSVDAFRVLAGSNVVGVVVGHYRHADDEPVDFATAADDVLRVTRAVRLVSDVPVLLAVGAVNIHTRDTERAWADAFGDDIRGFDGFAIYGLARFPAILEAVENPRELILRRMGLPDRPCILIEFVGTSFQYATSERAYVEKVWAARAKPLIAALRKQQWRGLVTWSATLDDARIKATALHNAMK